MEEINVSEDDRELLMDLRPYANTAPYSIQETASVQVSEIERGWLFNRSPFAA